MPATREQIRQIIADNNLNSVADVYILLKDSFKDIFQELMEAEPDATLGYEKNQKGDSPTSNKRNGHSLKTLKSRYGEFQIDVPRDREGEFEPKLLPKYQRDISGIEEKVISLCEGNEHKGHPSMTRYRIFTGWNCLRKWSARSQTGYCRK